MTVTLEDYWRAVDSFVAAMGPLGDDVRGILLRGSLARDEVVPGQSDLLDALVVVRHGLLEEPAEFRRVVQQILAACAPLAASGIPFDHPPNLFQEEELVDFDAIFGPTLVSPDSSRLLLGEDLRPRVRWSDEGQVVARCAYFSMKRRFMDRLSIFLPPLRLSAQQQGLLFDRLVDLSKIFPVIACAALGHSASQKQALAELRRTFPELEFSPFDRITALRKGERSQDSPEELQGLLRSVFELAERIEERILASSKALWSDLLAAGAPPQDEPKEST
jgi:hypothetical protein